MDTPKVLVPYKAREAICLRQAAKIAGRSESTVDGPIYQPKSVPGEFAQTVGEFIPGAGRNIVTGALLPGLASEAAGQVTKGTGLEPWARVAGGVAGALTGAVAPHTLTPAKTFVEPMTQGGQEAIAARTLGQNVSDLDKTRAALDQPSELVPDSMPTTFQQTGDLGLGQLERKQRMNAETAPTFIERDQSQNAARMGALQGIQQSGSPADVASRFRQMHEAIDQQAQDRISALRPVASDANAAMGGLGTADATGYNLRAPMAEARAVAKEHEDRLWGLVNQNAKVPANGISQIATDTKNGISQSATPMSGEEARIFDAAAGYPATQRFGDLKDLRSSITDETAAARAAGRTQTVRRLTILRKAVDDALDHGVENQAALEQIAVQRGLMAPQDAMDARLQALINTHYARQADASVARVANRRETYPGSSGGGSVGTADGRRAKGQGDSGSGAAASDQGIPQAIGPRPQQPDVRGSIAYQAPDFGNRSVSARMHAPEIESATGADVPGTLVRPFGGPLDRSTQGGKPTGIVAYHGTPHDFDRFSSAGIGTGEGAQAFGHGLYFAEKEGVARGYRDSLSEASQDIEIGGKRFDYDNASPDEKWAFDDLFRGDKWTPNIDSALRNALFRYENLLRNDGPNDALTMSAKRKLAILNDWKTQGVENAGGSKGHLYQVSINRPDHHFLDWDEPYRYQTPYVRDAIKDWVGEKDVTDPVDRTLQRLQEDPKWRGWDEDRAWLRLRELYPNQSDAALQGIADRVQLAAQRGERVGFNPASDAPMGQVLKMNGRLGPDGSAELSKRGIAGVKYLDSGSRSIGDGTRNYVTFNDHDIQITHKNGVELARPVPLPQFLRGQAAAAFSNELKASGVKGCDFSGDLMQRAMKIVGDGRVVDHPTALASAFIERAPTEVQNAILGRTAPRGRPEATRDGSAARDLGEGSRELPVASQGRGRVDQTGGASREAVPTFSPEDVANYRAATKATRQRAQTFDEGAAGRILQPAGRGGYAMPDAAVPSVVVPSGKPTDALAVRQFMAAGGTPEAIADATAYAIRSNTKRLDGTLDPNKVHSWLNKNQDALAEMPPDVAKRFRNVADSQTAVDEMVAKHEADRAAFNKTAIARIAGLQHGEDVVKTIGGIFGQKNAVQQMKALADAAASDPSARDGLRRTVVEHLLSRLTSNASVNASGISQIKGDTFIGFMGKNGAALSQVFKPQEMNTIAAIGNDLDRALRTHQTKGLTSSPGTAQDLGAAKGSILSELGDKVGPAGFAMVSHAAGANVLTSALSFLGAQTIGRMRAAGIANANDLVVKAMLDPALAKKLLAKVPDRPGQGTARALGDAFVRLSRATAAGEFASVSDRRMQ